jgi:CDK inhibitor PHO81
VAPPTPNNAPDPDMISSCGRTDMSIKEAVRIAQSNNFMGLICTSRLLDLVPALVDSIKEAGLVLISDYSYDVKNSKPGVLDLAKGVDGLVSENAVMRFKEAVD